MKRQAVRGEFRSNLHRGGKARKFRLSPDYRKTALAAARVLGLTVAGVDMIESAEGPMVMEVNSSPGLEGIQKSTGVNVANHHRTHRAGSAPAPGARVGGLIAILECGGLTPLWLSSLEKGQR